MESKSNEAVSKPEIFVLAAFAKLQIDFTSAYKDGWSANGIINLNNSIRDFSLTVAALPAKEIIAEALPIIIRQRTNDINPSLVNDDARAAIAQIIAENSAKIEHLDSVQETGQLAEAVDRRHAEELIDDATSARRYYAGDHSAAPFIAKEANRSRVGDQKQ